MLSVKGSAAVHPAGELYTLVSLVFRNGVNKDAMLMYRGLQRPRCAFVPVAPTAYLVDLLYALKSPHLDRGIISYGVRCCRLLNGLGATKRCDREGFMPVWAGLGRRTEAAFANSGYAPSNNSV